MRDKINNNNSYLILAINHHTMPGSFCWWHFVDDNFVADIWGWRHLWNPRLNRSFGGARRTQWHQLSVIRELVTDTDDLHLVGEGSDRDWTQPELLWQPVKHQKRRPKMKNPLRNCHYSTTMITTLPTGVPIFHFISELTGIKYFKIIDI